MSINGAAFDVYPARGGEDGTKNFGQIEYN